LQLDQALGLAIGGGKIDLRVALRVLCVQVGQFSHQFAGFADAGFGFAGAGFRSAAEPLDFSVNQIFERFLAFAIARAGILLSSPERRCSCRGRGASHRDKCD
jgi:hypothetical protein